jgi:hypothetical protein
LFLLEKMRWNCGPNRHKSSGMLTRLGLFLAVAALAAGANLQLVVSNETIPAGATGQIKIWVSPPAAIASGAFSASFDPAVFSEIVTAGAFGASGDVSAKASINRLSVSLTFSSVITEFTVLGSPILADGMGRLPDLPAFTFTVRVRSDLAARARSTITLDTSPAPWKDASGNTYNVSVTPGSVTVAGSLAIADVQPGGGNLPAGRVVQVKGAGFDPNASLTVAEVSIAGPQFISAQEIDFTLAAPSDITGKRVTITNPDGSESDFFPLLPGVAPDGTIYVFPLRNAQLLSVLPKGAQIQNPNLFPIDVTIVELFGPLPDPPSGTRITLPPGQMTSISNDYKDETFVASSGPVRNIDASLLVSLPLLNGFSPSNFDFAATAGSTRILSISPSVFFRSVTPIDSIQVVAATQSGNWLSVSQTPMNGGIRVTINANPTGLAAGTYVGTVTVSATALDSSASVTAPVRLDVVSGPITVLYPSDSAFVLPPTNAMPSLPIDRNLFPSDVTVTYTTDSTNWLIATYDPDRSLVAVNVNRFGLAPGWYTGQVVIKGSGNTQIVPVENVVIGSGTIDIQDESIIIKSFAVRDGTTIPSQTLVTVSPRSQTSPFP